MPPEGLEESRWYYKLGSRALGPVSWAEIEELLADSFEAEDLLIARVGEDAWRPAKDVIDAVEEEEEEDAGEVVAPEVAEEPPPDPLTPVHGLKPWLSQAWEIFAERPADYIGGSIAVAVLGSLSFVVCFPPVHAGFYAMALRRFRGEAPHPHSVMEGFSHFASVLGLYVLVILIALPFGLVLLVGAAGVIIALPDDAEFYVVLPTVTLLVWLIVSLAIALPGAAAFFSVPLIIDRKLGAIEALKQSWAVTQRNYLSYLGMTVVLLLVSGLGLFICWIGVLLTMPLLPLAQVCAYCHHFSGGEG